MAGTFYPGNERQLYQLVRELLDNGSAGPSINCKAVIAPHARYIYSGPMPAEAFAAAQIAIKKAARIVIVGPAHFTAIREVVAPSMQAFQTPLGEFTVDRDCIDLLNRQKLIEINDRPHIPEHSLKVELPFIQFMSTDCSIVPLLAGCEG